VALAIDQKDWNSPVDGVIAMPAPAAKFASHSVLLVGYDDSKRLFKIRNSYGANWGDYGHGYISYSYFDRYQHEAWVCAVNNYIRPKNSGVGSKILSYGILDYLDSTPVHCFEVFDCGADDRLGWAFGVERMGYLDIEEFFVRPSFRGRGYGRVLAQEILKKKLALNLSVRLWVSHADAGTQNAAPNLGVLKRLNLVVRATSGRRWAPYVAM
jgi:GNAT superfamily N-acetyltransferase